MATDQVCYYLGSRFYLPELGRFLNADIYADTGTGVVGTNMFAYCDNNPVRFIDPRGTNIYNRITYAASILRAISKSNTINSNEICGPVYDLEQGWKARIDKPNNPSSDGKSEHIHVWKNGEKYAQNKDGTSHDGLTGNPPKKVKDKLKQKTGWVWKKISYQPEYSSPEINLDYNSISVITTFSILIGVVVFLMTGNPSMLQTAA